MSFIMPHHLLPMRSRLSRAGRDRKMQPFRHRSVPAIEVLEGRCLLAVFTVTNTNDAGPGSLRQAILDANANPGLDTIAFAIGDGGVQTIQPKSSLPSLVGPVMVDGTTQPGFAGQPLIVLSGGPNFSRNAGLGISGSGSTVRGLVIQGFGAGIAMGMASSNNTITGNYLGTDVTGTQAVGNGAGVSLFESGNDHIGGTEPGSGNLISGNGVGIGITSESGPAPQPTPSPGIFIQGNSIGTDVTGTQAVPNGTGISIIPGSRLGVPLTLIGGTEAGAGNLISGNTNSGIVIQRSGGHIVQGNYIGTDRTGTRPLGNHAYGIDISQGVIQIGGTTDGARNLISGNGLAGVHIADNSSLIQGNWIGTDSTGSAAMGNGNGIRIDGSGSTVGGTTAGAGNLISGNFSAGVFLAGSDNRVQGNTIGTDAAGTGRVSNGSGVSIVSGSNNQIGGIESGAGNVISGNGTGVVIFSSRDNTVQGNHIGTDASGLRALGNGDGIALNGPDNLVGGTAAGAGNLISGNLQSGVSISSSGNTVQGNTMGTDLTGTSALGNEDGVYIGLGASNNWIGGTEAGAGNLISGNRNAGVLVSGQANLIQGNTIGTDISGSRALGNFTGVRIDGGSDNSIGGSSAAAHNLISGNLPSSSSTDGEGILISAGSRNVVEGNYIGTDSSGSQALGNRDGIRILGGRDNHIGGTQPGAGNLISGNLGTYIFDGEAILVHQSSGTLIQGNTIGLDVSGSRALSNRQGIDLDDSSGNTVGGTIPGAGNLISGNTKPGGINAGVTINGSNNLVQGNLIGTDATGTRAVGNGGGVVIGFRLYGSQTVAVNNLIGGIDPGARNLISGNGSGIYISSAIGTAVQGNYIGTDVSGSFALANGDGIFLGGDNTLIGGTVPGAGNVISGNSHSGVMLEAVNTRVEGNYIGTDITGTLAIPNARGVLSASAGPGTLIGGTDPAARNLISGNTLAGIEIAGGIRLLVQGNYIGTDVSGTLAVPNGTGVHFIFGPAGGEKSDNTIGGTTPGAGNLISGNTSDGILIGPVSMRNVAEGNRIGTDVTGMLPLGNGGNGVAVDRASGTNTIGGTVGGAGNTIAFNGLDGVLVTNLSSGIAIRQNSIFSNGGLGIELLSGGNRMQAAPVLTAATSSGGLTAVQGTLTSAANTTFTIELFANQECDPSGFGEGERFLASLTVATYSNGTASFQVILALPVEVGQFITATATDPAGNTSQFSNCVEVTMANPPSPPAGGGSGVDVRPVVVLDRFFASVHELDLPSLTLCDSLYTMAERIPCLAAARRAARVFDPRMTLGQIWPRVEGQPLNLEPQEFATGG